LVNGEKLSYQVCTEALDEMDKVIKGETGNCTHYLSTAYFVVIFIILSLFTTDYRLVIVCSNEQKEEKSYIMEHLQLSHRDAAAVMATKDDDIYSYLQHHMSKNVTYERHKIFASDVDPNKYVYFTIMIFKLIDLFACFSTYVIVAIYFSMSINNYVHASHQKCILLS